MTAFWRKSRWTTSGIRRKGSVSIFEVSSSRIGVDIKREHRLNGLLKEVTLAPRIEPILLTC